MGDPIPEGDPRAAKADEWLKSSTTSPLPPGDHARAEERDAHGTGDSVLDRIRDTPPDRSSRLTDPWVPTVGQQVVARWAMYGVTTMSKEELISQGVGGSTVAISHLAARDLSGVEVKDRLKMAENITGNIYVGPLDSRSLERIWTSFGEDFSKIASGNLALWRKCCVRHSGLVEKVKPAKDIYDAVRSDTLALASGYLKKNGDFVEEEMKAFGISDVEGKENAPATAGQTAAVTALQNAAHGLQALQFAQEAARDTWVGIGLSPDQTLALKGDDDDKTFVFGPVAYKPGDGKPPTTIPEGYFRDAKVVISVPPAAGAEDRAGQDQQQRGHPEARAAQGLRRSRRQVRGCAGPGRGHAGRVSEPLRSDGRHLEGDRRVRRQRQSRGRADGDGRRLQEAEEEHPDVEDGPSETSSIHWISRRSTRP